MDQSPTPAPLPTPDRSTQNPAMQDAAMPDRTVPSAGRRTLRAARGFVDRLARDEAGAEILEYVLIAGLIIVGTIVTIGSFGTKVLARWTSVNASM